MNTPALKQHPFFISCPRNLEPLLLAELRELGVEGGNAEYLGVTVPLSQEDVYRVVYGSRLASRVLRPLGTFECYSSEELYSNAYAFNWSQLIQFGQTFKITATVSDSGITHSHYAALKLKDAIVDSLRDQYGERPNVDREDPDIRIDLFLRRDQATISLYYSNGVLHRRGYRKQAVEAPIKENLAAALLRFSGWDKKQKLHDFFCGSGTLLLEAAMMATRTPAGFFRDVQGFETLPDFDSEVWEKVKSEMDSQIIPLASDLIFGSDIDAKAIAAFRTNLLETPFADAIHLERSDFNQLKGPFEDAVVVTNPPYGVRLEQGEDVVLHKLYESFGRFLKTQCPGGKVCMVIPDEGLEKEIWFKPAKRLFFDNGGLEVHASLYTIRKDG